MTANRLYFAQHGLAVDKTDDPARPLSKRGITQTTLIAAQLHKSQEAISAIFHSGKLRASQTAEIFAEYLSISNVSAVEYLSPNYDALQTIEKLSNHSVLYIGHLPHLDKLIAQLLTGNENMSIINFQNSAVLSLENDQTRYRIQAYITSDTLTFNLKDN